MTEIYHCFLQSYEEANPNTTRKHLFSDAVFYPDMMTGYSIDGEDTANLTIQNSDASVKVTLSNDTIKLKATNIIGECTDFTINSENTNINATTKTTITSPLTEISGATNIMGIVSALGYQWITWCSKLLIVSVDNYKP